MSSLEGIQMGLPSHPRIKSGGTPKPYARPSIDLAGPQAVRREWKQVPAGHVCKGDNVPGVGAVTGIDLTYLATEPPQTWVRIYGGAGNSTFLHVDQPVFCFTAAAEAAPAPARGD